VRLALRSEERGQRPGKDLLPPGMPIHGIPRMLVEVWALFLPESVRGPGGHRITPSQVSASEGIRQAFETADRIAVKVKADHAASRVEEGLAVAEGLCRLQQAEGE
jgi:hypothetical protein